MGKRHRASRPVEEGDLMFYVYVEDQIESSYRSPVAADLRVKELALRGIDAHVEPDEGAR